MSTIAPADTRASARPSGARLGFIDAPVTGSSPKAEDGTLTIMAGGDRADFARARPLFEVMGELVVHVGELGHGQIVKLINNAVAASNASTLAQALIVGRATGVDLEALRRSWAPVERRQHDARPEGGADAHHDYTTLFKLEHMLKDVRLCLEEGQAAGVPFPAAADAREDAQRRDGTRSRGRRFRRPSVEVPRGSQPSAFERRKTRPFIESSTPTLAAFEGRVRKFPIALHLARVPAQ